MTVIADVGAPRTRRDRGRPQRLSDVVRAERVAAWTLRPQRALWIGAVAGGLIGTASAIVLALVLVGVGAEALPAGEIDALMMRAPTAGAITVALLLGFAAVHRWASERSSGRLLITDVSVPDRRRTVVARAIVTVVTSAGVAVVTFALALGAVIVVDLTMRPEAVIDGGRQVLTLVAAVIATVLIVMFAFGLAAVIDNGVVAAAALVGVLIVIPAALGTVGATAGQEAYAWVASMMPAGRLGAVLESASAGELGAVGAALGVLTAWVVVMLVVAWLPHVVGRSVASDPDAGADSDDGRRAHAPVAALGARADGPGRGTAGLHIAHGARRGRRGSVARGRARRARDRPGDDRDRRHRRRGRGGCRRRGRLG